MRSTLRSAATLFALLTLVTGLAYPLIVTGAAQLLFPSQANGSIVTVHDRAVGSKLVGQHFDDPRYFWGRPSATPPEPYHGAASAGSNLGPSNPAHLAAVRERVATLQAADPGDGPGMIPIDLVTASASGLDPHISPAAALGQVRRVARVRGLSEARVRALVEAHVETRTLGILGEPRVNVLLLNLGLDHAPQTGA